MKKPILSIIIPFYNTSWEMFKTCIDSIKKQDADDYEVLIINDKSQETYGFEMCRKYIGYDERYKFYDNDINKGVSYTRNRGIELSNGKYIMFVDSDDWLEDGALSQLLQKVRENYDTIFFEYQRCDGKNIYPLYRQINTEKCDKLSKEMIERMILSIDYNSPCTILYSKEIIQKNNIYFKENVKMGEDFLFNVEYLQKYSKGFYLKEIFYNYRYNINSATNSFNMQYVKDCGEGYKTRKKLIEKYLSDDENNIKVKDKFVCQYIKSAFTYIINGFANGESKETMNECIQLYWIQEVICQKKVVGVKHKIYRFMLKYKMYVFLKMCGLLKKCLKKSV